MLSSGEPVLDIIDLLMRRSTERTVLDYIDSCEHRPAIMRCLHKLVIAFGFKDIFDGGCVAVGDAEEEAMRAAYKDFKVCVGVLQKHSHSASYYTECPDRPP